MSFEWTINSVFVISLFVFINGSLSHAVMKHCLSSEFLSQFFIPYQIINFDSARGGISLVTEKGLKSVSRLLVQRARGADAGVYACGPNNAPLASTRVHVLSGKLFYQLF